MVRKPLSTKVNRTMIIYATFGGIHLPKGGNFFGRTILLKNVRSEHPSEHISDHMWTHTNNHLEYTEYQNGDRLKIFGKVIKYFKYSDEKPKKDFTIEILSCEKVDGYEKRPEKTSEKTGET